MIELRPPFGRPYGMSRARVTIQYGERGPSMISLDITRSDVTLVRNFGIPRMATLGIRAKPLHAYGDQAI